MMPPNTIFFQIAIAVNVIQFVLYLWVLGWVAKVSKDKNCACANNWRRTYICIFPIFHFIIQALIMTSVMKTSPFHHFTALIGISNLVGWILMITFTFQYIRGLKKLQCKCATQNKSGDNALLAFSIIQAIVMLLAFIGIILIVSTFAIKKSMNMNQ